MERTGTKKQNGRKKVGCYHGEILTDIIKINIIFAKPNVDKIKYKLII